MIRTSTQSHTRTTGKFTAVGLTAFLVLLLLGNFAKAQILYSEGFESTPAPNTPTLPLGWVQGKYGAGTDPDNYWDRRMTGQFPVIAPHGGSMMARYLSWSVTA